MIIGFESNVDCGKYALRISSFPEDRFSIMHLFAVAFSFWSIVIHFQGNTLKFSNYELRIHSVNLPELLH